MLGVIGIFGPAVGTNLNTSRSQVEHEEVERGHEKKEKNQTN
jgi:hypothetical protein